jgi:hypothetical protein
VQTVTRKKTLSKDLLFEEPVHFGDLQQALTVSQKDAFVNPKLDDAAVVIRATSILDALLKFAFTARLRCEPSKTALAEVFEGNGPLATFSAKITLAAAMGITRGDARHDLKVLKKIRNDFAHSMVGPKLAGDPRCRSLKMQDKSWPQIKQPERRRFCESASSLIIHLVIASAALMVEEELLHKHAREGDRLTKEFISWIMSDGKGKAPF